ncbi:glycine cleavage system protein GcvH [Streptomyces sp. NPDC005805]|uniref:glycine cleavage system protein GcvH n=1 Tax=Streptomyces sp. NPDC005805 TaxID=3157068 RepID=UPI0033F7EE40
MANVPDELRYTDSHEWARLEPDGTVTVGLTDHAQLSLGDLVFVEPGNVGKKHSAGDPVGTVESVKAASDFYAPVGGEVVAVNEEVSESPELINEEPYSSWIFKLRPTDPAELDKLLNAAVYRTAIEE